MNLKKLFVITLLLLSALVMVLTAMQVFMEPKDDKAFLKTAKVFIDDWRLADQNPSLGQENMRLAAFEVQIDAEHPQIKSLTIENAGLEPLRNFWLFAEGAPNFYGVDTILDSVTNSGQSIEEQVLALFSLFPLCYENFYPIDKMGRLGDPGALLGSVGYGQCNYAVDAFSLLCQKLGCETRSIGLAFSEEGMARIAHHVMEVKYDGTWHYFDPDGRVYYPGEDVTVASAAELSENPEIILEGPQPVGYDRRSYAAAFERGTVAIYEPHKPLLRKQMYENMERYPAMYRQSMRYDLPPGMKVTLESGKGTRFFMSGLGAGEKRLRGNAGLPPCASGRAEWKMPSGRTENEWILNGNGNRVGVINLPFVIAGATILADGPMTLEWQPFISGPLYSEEFQSLGEFSPGSKMRIDRHFPVNHPLRGFAFQSYDDKFSAIQFQIDFQHNPRSLPQLQPGRNRFLLYCPWDDIEFSVENSTGRSTVTCDNGLRITIDYSDASNQTPSEIQ